PIDRFFDVLLLRAASAVRSHGMLWLTYDHVEFLGNVLLFIPLGLAVTIVLPRVMHWIVPMVALVLSALIEFVQFAALPDRFGGTMDVVANVIGAVIGWATVLAVSWVRSRSPKKGDGKARSGYSR